MKKNYVKLGKKTKGGLYVLLVSYWRTAFKAQVRII